MFIHAGRIRRIVEIDDPPELLRRSQITFQPPEHRSIRVDRSVQAQVRIDRNEVRVAPVERVIPAAVRCRHAVARQRVKVEIRRRARDIVIMISWTRKEGHGAHCSSVVVEILPLVEVVRAGGVHQVAGVDYERRFLEKILCAMRPWASLRGSPHPLSPRMTNLKGPGPAVRKRVSPAALTSIPLTLGV